MQRRRRYNDDRFVRRCYFVFDGLRVIMTRSRRILSGASACLVLVCTMRASGQIDNRVNQGNATTAGRLLENNPQIGSSGYNITRPGLYDSGARANAIISGNVSGLAGFKGDSPVLQNNQFRDSLPSAGLTGFQGRSVGLRDVLSGNTYETGFYYGTAETISDVGFIRAGLNQTGTPALRSTSFRPPSVSVPDARPSPLLQSLGQPEDRRVNISRPDLRPGVSPYDPGIKTTPAGVGLGSKEAARILTPYRDAMGSSIFGTPIPPLRPSASRPTGSVPLPSISPLSPVSAADELARAASGGSTDPGLQRIDTAVPQPSLDPLVSPIEGGLSDQALTEFTPIVQSVIEGGAAGPGQPPVTLGADRYADLYSAVTMAQSMGIQRLGFDAVPEPAAPAVAAGSSESALKPFESSRGGLLRRPSDGFLELASAAKWASDVLEHPLTTFTGHHQSRLNDYMRSGEQELHAGRYYDAARYFELASTIDPLNPLPLLARGHALAAAGDYRSAVRFLVMGIERFPQVAAFRIDLPALIGRIDVFDVRRADLESKLAKMESPELRFLLGYLELYSGLPEEGIRNLRQAAEASDPTSIIGMFVDLVTGQRELPPLTP